MNKLLCGRIVQWNRARYRRAYSHKLFSDMLFEEYTEYMESVTLSDKLDGLADLYFINIGAMWKMNLEPFDFLSREVLVLDWMDPNVDSSQKELLTSVTTKLFETEDEYIIKKQLSSLIEIITKEFFYIGCNKDQAYKALQIICDSNDSKEIIKLDIHTKGSLKGTKFVPPFIRLKLLAEVIRNVGN